MITTVMASIPFKVFILVCLVVLVRSMPIISFLKPRFVRRRRKTGPGSLVEINYNGANDEEKYKREDVKFEIIAVHGLAADPEYTWTCKAENPELGRVHLLELLGKHFPDARIMVFSHSSDWLFDASISSVNKTGERLSTELLSHREESSSQLPIVFIGHSFGGIVIKEALNHLARKKQRFESHKQYAKHILRSTRGILFLGTPHQGSPLSTSACILAQITGMFGSDTALVRTLQTESTELSRIEDNFKYTKDLLCEAKIYSFYEGKHTHLGPFPISIVVTKDSARGLSDYHEPLDTDHSGLNKCPGGEEDPVFKDIKRSVQKVTTSVSPTVSRADELILDYYAKDSRLHIQRISGAKLPMDSCYINLNIVHQSFHDDQHVDKIPPPDFNISLSQRLNTQELQDEHQIKLPDLFNPRKIRDEEDERRPRRILIRGRPGVGKSTLCKKIISDFVRLKEHRKSENGNQDTTHRTSNFSYCGHFARLLWVPLRSLAARQDPFQWKWLLGMYFTQMGDPEAAHMIEALAAHLQNPNTDDDTLFLLDGMDEIAASLEDGSNLKEVVNGLLEQRNIIVTSRPSHRFNQERERETFDIELETIGFHKNQVKDYVEKVEVLNAAKILELLRNRPLLQDLVRIPVQLDALCYAWKEKAGTDTNGAPTLDTMTDLYQAIERALWKKDAARFGRLTHVSKPRPVEIERSMENEIILLENLAYDGLRTNHTVFNAQFIEHWSARLPSKLLSKKKGLDGTLQCLSYIRSPDVDVTDSDPKRGYYFLHLTQQEYFAARYLKRQWIQPNSESEKAIAFFQKHRYSEQYDVVWRFLAGLLGSHDDIRRHSLAEADHENVSPSLEEYHLDRYFEEIQKEPHESQGSAHERLVTHCLREVPLSRPLLNRADLDQQIASWSQGQDGKHNKSPCRRHEVSGATY